MKTRELIKGACWNTVQYFLYIYYVLKIGCEGKAVILGRKMFQCEEWNEEKRRNFRAVCLCTCSLG